MSLPGTVALPELPSWSDATLYYNLWDGDAFAAANQRNGLDALTNPLNTAQRSIQSTSTYGRSLNWPPD